MERGIDAVAGFDLSKAVEWKPLELGTNKKKYKVFRCEVVHSLMDMVKDLKPGYA